jgi:hypothetical protein
MKGSKSFDESGKGAIKTRKQHVLELNGLFILIIL